ncbi:HAD-IC family P-type ATPase, partial [Dokdonella sp.]|uniref:HAD-IC family P-type ATPase n=1 Tax=Dokdonella sp. TaxID=2291710 RepID=UPI002F40A95C
AVPAALTRALALLARRGVLVVHVDAIEALAGATHVVFDKTGTLTEPCLAREREPIVDGAIPLAAALARRSRHPVARALVDAAAGIALPVAEDVEEVAGCGLRGRVGGRALRLGRADFAIDPLQRTRHGAIADDALVLADDDGAIAAFQLSERVRPGARAALAALSAQGLELEIASGDATSKVAALAADVGIRRWHARQSPADKLERLRALRASGGRVVAVGDGVNDAPVLAGADVAVAIGGGSDLAQASADVVLARADLTALPEAIAIARETLQALHRNQRWAIAYNLVAVPFGALGLVPPWLAALGMSASSLVVVLNATRIGRRRAFAAAGPDTREAFA